LHAVEDVCFSSSMATTPTHAKAFNSPVRHLLVAGTKTTKCGKDATLMARYAMSDLPSGERTNGRDCTACRKEA
jgi:hypothetical protein